MPKKSKAATHAGKPDVNDNLHYRSPARSGRALETFDDCSVCSEDVSDCENNILCDFCGHWIHFDCADVTPDLFKALSTATGGTFWSCKSCRSPDLPKRLRLLHSLQQRQDKLEQSFANLSLKVDSLPAIIDDKVTKIDEKINSIRASLKTEIVSEILEVKKRKTT